MTKEELLAGGAGREEVIKLASELRDEIKKQVGGDGTHGGIRPENIFRDENGTYRLGEPRSRGTSEMLAEELEYVSPEFFWDGKDDPSGDVYSLGLLLYGVVNGGRLPLYPEGEATPTDRAGALRSRMQGEKIPAPEACDENIASAILKAVSFEKKERWQSVDEFCAALAGADMAETAVVPPVVAAEEPKNAVERKYTVDKAIPEPTVPKKRKQPKRAIIALAVIVALVLAILLAAKGCSKDKDTADEQQGAEIPVSIIDEDENQQVEGGENDSQGAETAPELDNEEPNDAEPTNDISYSIVKEDLTWEEAKAKCEEQGGHLAVVHSQEELDKIIAMAESQGVKYIWLGASRNAAGEWEWVNGDKVDFYVWDINEPSYKDGYDGAAEDYLMLWYVTFGSHTGWAYNDSRIDPAAAYPASYAGQIAYVCQFD